MAQTSAVPSSERDLPPSETVSVGVAAARLGLSRGKAYELARRNALPVPVIRFGRKMVIPSRALDRVLLVDEPQETAVVAQVA
jgi:excisionase family DNA binding protein